MLRSALRLVVGSMLLLPSLARPAAAQCTTATSPMQALGGVNGIVRATLAWDRDGTGPLPPVLVVGGTFTVAGDQLANGIAVFDPAAGTWSVLGSGMTTVRALALLPNGDLVAGGEFTTAGGVAASNIASWNGASWAPLGAGFNAAVHALAVRANGELIAGGAFWLSGTTPMGIGRWTGTTWLPVASGAQYPVHALAAMPNGDVIAGGAFGFLGTQFLPYVARWDGTTWSALGSAPDNGVLALTRLANGDLIAGGTFTNIGGVYSPKVARWNGTSWSAVGNGIFGARVNALCDLGNGAFAAAGDFLVTDTTGPTPAYSLSIASWTGSAWVPLASGLAHTSPDIPQGHALAMLPTGLVVGGAFNAAGGTGSANVARWSGVAWQTLGAGGEAAIDVAVTLPNGDVVAGGAFRSIGGVVANRIARWDGVAWHALGTGMNGNVTALAVAPDGAVIAGGKFRVAGGVPAQGLARWFNGQWTPIGPPIVTQYGVHALAFLPNGDLVVAGYLDLLGWWTQSTSQLARWNGTAWSTIVTNGHVRDLALAPNGDLLAGGEFDSIGGVAANGIARLVGAGWQPLGAGVEPRCERVLALRNGEVLVSGVTQAGGVPCHGLARWDGAAWQPVGTAPGITFRKAIELPDGSVLMGGSFPAAGGVAARNLVRRNGVAWTPVADTDGVVEALTLRPRGDVVAGGRFATVAGAAAPFAALLVPTCAAAAISLGGGCASSGGANMLAATELPWTGGTFRAQATGLPLSGFAVAVTGFAAAAVPLASLLPQGVAGCSLLASPDVVDVVLPAGGAAATALAIPAAQALAGLQLRHQVVPIETAANGAFVSITSTNLLALTIGVW
jgi:hypothetical protein